MDGAPQGPHAPGHPMMENYEHKSKRLQRQGCVLLCLALALGIAATSRMFGTDGISTAAAVLLACATAFAVIGWIRLSPGGRIPFGNTRRVFLVLAGVHLVSMLFFFPPEDILNDRPVLTLDHAVHYYQTVRAGEIRPNPFRLYVYDPYFMAGYPGGTVFDIDSKGTELFGSLLRFMGTARALKLFILLAHLLMVASVYFGCRRLGFRNDECAFATVLALSYWHWGRPYAGDFRFAGMFAFLFVTHLSLYLVGLFRSFLANQSNLRFFVLGPLVFLVHPTAAVLLPVPFLAIFLLQRRRIPGGRLRGEWAKNILIRLLLWCLLVVAVNSIWIIPLVHYLDIKLPSDVFFQIKGFGALLGLLLKPGNIPALGLCLLAAAGCVRLIREARHIEWAAPASGALFLFSLASYGVYLPGFNQMEPGRFLYSALIFLAPLSGAGLKSCFEVLERKAGRRARSIYIPAVFIFLLVSPPWLGLLSARTYFKHTLSTTFSPGIERLLDALKDNTDSSGRLMVEDGPARRYGNFHLPSILPLWTGVEQIGGPYPYTFIKHHFATFQKNETMGRPLFDWEPAALSKYLGLYNIRWILTASPQVSEFVAKMPGIEEIWSQGHFHLWRTPVRGAFAETPGVTVHATYNRIDVTVSPGGDSSPPDHIILKYHWDRSLRVEPPARISLVMRLDDPVPFIRLEPHGEKSVRITFGR